MFKVMVTMRTLNGMIDREVGAFGGPVALQRATDFAEYWRTVPYALLVRVTA